MFKVNNLRFIEKARKSHTCEVCGCEIPKGDSYYIFKPFPVKGIWYGWRKRCIEHKPKYYEEVMYYEDKNADTIQSARIGTGFKVLINYN